MSNRNTARFVRAALLIALGLISTPFAPSARAGDCGAPVACVAPPPGFPPSSGNTPLIDMGLGWATFLFGPALCPGGAPICSTIENLHHLDDPCVPAPPRCWCPAPMDYGHAWISHNCDLTPGAASCSTTLPLGGPWNAFGGGGPGSVVCNMPLTAPAGAVPPQIGLNPGPNSCDINSDPPFGVTEPPEPPVPGSDSLLTCADPAPVPVGGARLYYHAYHTVAVGVACFGPFGAACPAPLPVSANIDEPAPFGCYHYDGTYDPVLLAPAAGGVCP